MPILDFIPAEGKLEFPPLTLTKQFKVKIRRDRIREATETFKVVLFHADNTAIGDGEATGTILDDDTP